MTGCRGQGVGALSGSDRVLSHGALGAVAVQSFFISRSPSRPFVSDVQELLGVDGLDRGARLDVGIAIDETWDAILGHLSACVAGFRNTAHTGRSVTAGGDTEGIRIAGIAVAWIIAGGTVLGGCDGGAEAKE